MKHKKSVLFSILLAIAVVCIAVFLNKQGLTNSKVTAADVKTSQQVSENPTIAAVLKRWPTEQDFEAFFSTYLPAGQNLDDLFIEADSPTETATTGFVLMTKDDTVGNQVSDMKTGKILASYKVNDPNGAWAKDVKAAYSQKDK